MSDEGRLSILRTFDAHNSGLDFIDPTWGVEATSLAARICTKVVRNFQQALSLAAGEGLTGLCETLCGNGAKMNKAYADSALQLVVSPLDRAVSGGRVACAQLLQQKYAARFWSLGLEPDDPELQRHCPLHGAVWGMHWDLQEAAERYAADNDGPQHALRALLAVTRPAPGSQWCLDPARVLAAGLASRKPARAMQVLVALWEAGLRLRGHPGLLSELLQAAVRHSNAKNADDVYTVLDFFGLSGIPLENGEPFQEAFSDSLLLACRKGRPEALRLLLEAKGDPTATGRWGNSLLHCLCLVGRDARSVRLLLSRRADPGIRNYLGRTPLHYLAVGCGEGCREIATVLLEGRADANSPMDPVEVMAQAPGFSTAAFFSPPWKERGQTCLHLAVRSGSHQAAPLARALLDGAADVNARDETNMSVLHAAIEASPGTSEVVALLLERRADPEARNARGETPNDLIRAQSWAARNEEDRVAVSAML